MAFSITDVLFNLLVGGAISAALIPVLTGYLAKNKEKEGWKILSIYMNIIFVIILLVCVIGFIFSPEIVGILASKYSNEKKDLTIVLVRILFPSVIFIMFSGILNGVLYSYKRFSAAAFGLPVYNILSVLSIIIFGKYSVKAVVTGIMISAIIFLLINFIF